MYLISAKQFPCSIELKRRMRSCETPVLKQTQYHTIMERNNNNNRGLRIHAFSSRPPPSPPMLSFVAALATATLIFLCLYVFSAIVSVAILLLLYITTLFLCKFMHREETPPNQRVVRIFNKLFWVVDENRGSHREQVTKLLGCVACFGSRALTSSVSECVICLEDFKKGEECLVFSVCGHTFHCDCINHWLQEKPTCPICRHCVPSPAIP
ncbi:putative E3 ubiquitin-protein ligase ATL44, partial [Mucuna pruriens]